MAWIDQLERVKHPDGRELIGASFRGVPFFVEDSDLSGGRRFAKKQFIDGDLPKVIDLGKEANAYRVQGYVLGDNYLVQKNALLDALQEVAGAGTLVHPFYGRNLRVQVGPVSVRESKKSGGWAEFSIDFHNAPEISPARVELDLSAAVDEAASDTIDQNSSDLDATLVTDGQPTYSLESLSDELRALAVRTKERLSLVTEATQELANMARQLDDIALNASILVRTPVVMLEDLQSAITVLAETIEEHTLGVVTALLSAYALEPLPPAIGDTEARVQERANQTAFYSAIRIVLIAEACRIVPGAEFASVEEAEETRGGLIDAIDELVEVAENSTYAALINLRSSVLQAVPGDAVLRRLVNIEQFADTPSLTLAYRIQGTVDGEEDLLSRNNVKHPGFVSGSLRVLSDV